MTEYMIYKILSAEDWARARQTGISQTALDEGDGYVHFSTRDQVAETLRLHYKGAMDVRLLECRLEGFTDLRWEPARDGTLFPHLYEAFSIHKAQRVWTLELGVESVPKLPEDL